MSEIRIKIYTNGVLTEPSAIVTGDAGGDYGVDRLDTFASVVAIDQAFTKLSDGYYRYVFTDPEEDLTYRWAAKITYESIDYYVGGEMGDGILTTIVVLPSILSYYTSQAEVLRVMGANAETLILEDLSDRGNAWTDVLTDVTETVGMYVMQHYNPNNLYTNGWIRRRATFLAANVLSSRRGAPPVYSTRVDRIYEELDDIRNGRFHIPGATVRHFQGPVVRNYQMQNRFWVHPVRVESSKSTNAGTYAGEDIAIEPYIYYSSVL